jgi:LacI family transcriptional regulator
MPHHFLVKDIAFQAGVSTATVDRVLNQRQGVRAQTKARIAAAIHELERQENNLARGGKTFVIDVLMEAPDRFTHEVRAAFESEAGAFFPNMFRVRFQNAEVLPEDDFVRIIERIRLRGSDGVIVKGQATIVVEMAIRALVEAGIPVITLVTDLPNSGRLAYAGMNNRAAGETAAYLIAQTLNTSGGRVLATLSSARFHGEEERVTGFRNALSTRYKNIELTEISEGFGRDAATGALVLQALLGQSDICAVYSAGGGNLAILKVFKQAGRHCHVFVAHDLDAENRVLLANGQIDYVLHHNLKQDIRAIFQRLLQHHRKDSKGESHTLSEIMVVTPFNTVDNG